MKKFVATAALAVALSAVAAAPALATDSNAEDNAGLLNGNQLDVGNVNVPVNVDCNAVSVIGDAVASDDCKGEATVVNESPKPSETPVETTKPVSNEETLPVTGVSTGIIAGTAALMVVGGVFAMRVARRRGRHAGAAA